VSRTLKDDRREWRSFGVVVLAAGLCYLAMYSRQWELGGSDDAYYLSVARNLVLGRGFTWQGMPVVLVPPGWPLFLSVAMRVSPSFAFLNLLTALMCAGAAGVWFWILRDFTNRPRAMVTAVIAATIFEWYRFSNMLYAESLFFLLFSTMLLLALQIRRGRSMRWRLPLILVLLAAATATRYGGVLLVPVVAAALLPPRLLGDWGLLSRRTLPAAAVVLAVGVTAYFGLRASMQAVGEARLRESSRAEGNREAARVLSKETNRSAGALGAGLSSTARSVSRGGRWMSRLLWPPAVAGKLVPGGEITANMLGWLLLVLLGVRGFHGLRRGEWVWAGAAAYCVFLFSWSGKPVPRYLSPIAPLLVLGVWGGFRVLRVNLRRPQWRRKVSLAAAAFLAAVVLCNGAIWAVNVRTVRSDEFVNRALAGKYGELVGIARVLRRHGIEDGELAVYAEYEDLVRRGGYRWDRRVLDLLLDRRIEHLPGEAYEWPPAEETAKYARGEGIRFIVASPPNRPSRIWHFRFPSPHNEEGGESAGTEEGPYQTLWAVEADGCRRVPVPPVEGGVFRVPGL
jgi:hypothetical protein